LEDGLGDTIRVSLTEEPEAEIPVAKALVDRYLSNRTDQIPEIDDQSFHPYEYLKRQSLIVKNIGGDEVPRVIIDLSDLKKITPADLKHCGHYYNVDLDKWTTADAAADFLYVGKGSVDFELPGMVSVIQDADVWSEMSQTYPLLTDDFSNISTDLNFVLCSLENLGDIFIHALPDNSVLMLEAKTDHAMVEMRVAFLTLKTEIPVIMKREFNELDREHCRLYSSIDFGGLLIDGFGDGIWLNSKHNNKFINQTSFGILQATRTRISRTEYISCPSCGRTLFDLQETTAMIRKRTDHLKGLKIGIMGCIVNGPGEMADADYGYVGSGRGVISLYKGKEVVRKNIPAENAVDELIELIKEYDDWVDC
ncbi:MAG TPA: 1-hydroxy-2-methyl-2-(E)-butenyl 4-diphosphate synthase, partial [Candidatus Marinimicrobia bacterium]|nr:1-hydroxy-2-methyl-2-(E)-butenyl 4-diphosphate synthase [Candidatus Neomarinimicrobiota bacterium]